MDDAHSSEASSKHGLVHDGTVDAWQDWLDRGNGLKQETARAYASAMAYWCLWHRARYGHELPVLLEPPRPVTADVLTAFELDHTPRFEEGSIQPSMSPAVLAQMRTAWPSVARCPREGTTRVRYSALRHVHERMDLTFPFSGPRGASRHRLRGAWASEAAQEPGHGSSMGRPRCIDQLLAACTPDTEGRMEAALAVALQYALPSRVSSLTAEQVRRLVAEGPWPMLHDPQFVREHLRRLLLWAVERSEVGGQDAYLFPSPQGGGHRHAGKASLRQRITRLAVRAGIRFEPRPGIRSLPELLRSEHRDLFGPPHPRYQIQELVGIGSQQMQSYLREGPMG